MERIGRGGRVGAGPSDYSPEIVDRWLTQWDLLVSLAESPRTSVHHLRSGHAHRDGPCDAGPRIPGGQPSDGLAFALVLADLEAAAARLEVGSLERRVVHARMGGGGTLTQIAVILRTQKGVVLDAYKAGVVRMAELLGWLPEPE